MTVASMHFINGVNIRNRHTYRLQLWVCIGIHELCASLSLHAECTPYNFYNMPFIPLCIPLSHPSMLHYFKYFISLFLILCFVLFSCLFQWGFRRAACQLFCDFLLENDLLLSWVCACACASILSLRSISKTLFNVCNGLFDECY